MTAKRRARQGIPDQSIQGSDRVPLDINAQFGQVRGQDWCRVTLPG